MQLSEVPYISNVPSDGRAVLLQPWFSGTEWFSYVDAPSGEVYRALPGSMDSGIYYAQSPASEVDLEFGLGTLIAQHLSFSPVADQLYKLVEDIHMLSASMEKLDLIWRTVADTRGAQFLIETELEYLFVLLRAMYDVLHKVVREVTPLLQGPDGRRVVQELPDSFRPMVLKGKPQVRRTADDLSKSFGLPRALARWYENEAERFQIIRDVRVGIEHQGRRIPPVYTTERGFAVGTKDYGAWSRLEVWRRHELLPNDLGSVRALAASLAESFLGTLDRCADALRRVIDPALLPAPVSAGNKVFVTNPYIGRLGDLPKLIASPWEFWDKVTPAR